MTSLQFFLTTKEEIDQSNVVEFRPDPEKKSAYWVKDCRSASPAHGYIRAGSSGPFLLGGLQIISNSRTVEIYLKQNDPQEMYLTACRGVPSEGNYKIVCVIPGGPRPIQQAHLKFVTDEPELIITSLRVTARIPEIIQSSQPEPSNQLPDHNPSSPPSLPTTTTTRSQPASTDTTSDLHTSLASLAFLLRNTSEKHSQQIQYLSQQQQQAMSLWQPLLAQMASQASQQNEQMEQQTRLLQQQQEQIQALTSQVQELTNLVQRAIENNSSSFDQEANDPSERGKDGCRIDKGNSLTIHTEEEGPSQPDGGSVATSLPDELDSSHAEE
ncbi:hypothetical protein FisN_16Hh100 [Fistulifera solaris]|uniref:Uncharacterized protein n=1 Tax=Fistulifera solaris TaxID=1519565 RepID=A0A1Z5KT35_FISSO|nr:hypothetical protein FisN_16Hh100 [Fistulifera solaris]|eukprot:GAX29459.1 hypothetical protein FisN_16Hh100 [Fistulifera solaris]